MKETGVYILLCSNGRYYVGSTDNVKRRIIEHQSGKSKATRNILPVKLIKFIECDSLTAARQLEFSIKKMKSRKYIEKLISIKFVEA